MKHSKSSKILPNKEKEEDTMFINDELEVKSNN